MPVAATGFISLSIENLRDLVARSPTWQTWTGSTLGTAEENATRARLFTYSMDLPTPDAGQAERYEAAELTGIRPLVLIDAFLDPAYGGGFELARNAHDYMRDGGALLLRFEADVAAELAGDEAQAKRDFINRIGNTLYDIGQLANTDGQLAINHIATLSEAMRSDNLSRATQGDYFFIYIGVRYGAGSGRGGV